MLLIDIDFVLIKYMMQFLLEHVYNHETKQAKKRCHEMVRKLPISEVRGYP